ncbi:MAG: arginine repressor [Clostridia bacterium]|nr:arginine repressor [Clostridia bacterium]
MKIERHSQIIRLINQYDIETQEELAEKLNESGFQVTQATVSRDIRELKLTKIAKPGGGSRYAVLQSVDQEMSKKYINVLKASFQSMDLAQNILVVKTVSGMAMAAAAALDEMRFPEIVGCIAGDNTIMCAIRSADEALLLMEKIRKMLDNKNE